MGISWLYVYYVVFGYVPTMGLSQFVYVFCSFRTAVLDYTLIWYSQLCILCIFRHSLKMGLSIFVYGLK